MEKLFSPVSVFEMIVMCSFIVYITEDLKVIQFSKEFWILIIFMMVYGVTHHLDGRHTK
jgi:hypothetical protein